MIISRTPYRISFFGGGSDMPEWFRDHGGAVFGTTIDKYCYITYRQLPHFFPHTHRIVYSKVEHVRNSCDIEHPGVRETLKFAGVKTGVEIHHDGDLPAHSGTGSSSAFVVGLLNAIYNERGQTPTPKMLADEAIYIERELANEVVGYQDQIWAAYGGLAQIIFTNDDFVVKRLQLSKERLEELHSHLLLFYTGNGRKSSPIAASYLQRLQECRSEMRRTCEMVAEGIAIVAGRGDLSEFGRLLHESWELKKRRGYGVSSDHIDARYAHARSLGALGGKLIGAGGAGFLLLFAPPENHRHIIKDFDSYVHVPFEFENTGSSIIYKSN